MGWEEQSLSGAQEEPGGALSGEARTGRVTLTSGRARSALWGEGNLWKAGEGERKAGKEQVTSEGFDKDSGMPCVSSKHRMFSDLPSAHLLHTGCSNKGQNIKQG